MEAKLDVLMRNLVVYEGKDKENEAGNPQPKN
jgi:hypothetical protein